MYELPRTEQLKYLDFMQRDVDRLSVNIPQIIDLAKFEEKKFALTKSRVNIRHFTDDLLAKNDHLFKNVEMSINGGEEPIILEVDFHLIEVLLMNIFSNAINYNESGNKRIDVFFKKDKNKVVMSFRDNGIGIDKKNVKKIFKKFFRVKKVVKGSGIGLYMSQQIVKLHQGKIWASSAGVGEGTTFHVSLPRITDHES